MQELIIYLLKSAGLIGLFYAAYYFLLRNDTNFKRNRFFLIAGVFTSLFLPLLQFTRTILVPAKEIPFALQNITFETTTGIDSSNPVDWWQIAGIAYLVGLGFFLLKFSAELFSLLKLIHVHEKKKEEGFYLIKKEGVDQPFSFFKYIVIDPAAHSASELKMILSHEQTHARQWHSLDQLLINMMVYLFWFNPFAWLYRKSVVQNLEYLADNEVISKQESRNEYQKTLLKISIGGAQPSLTNQFYQSLIKKRIIMLNRNTAQKTHFWKTGIVLPFLALFIFTFNIKTEAQETPSQSAVTSRTEITVYITKTSDQKALNAFKKLFKNQGIDLKFENVNFSEGILTNITVSFESSSGANGNLSLNNSEGIGPLMISTDGSSVTMTPVAAVPETAKNPLEDIGNSPLFVIGGKEYEAAQLFGKYVQIKGDWKVLKPREARSQFGRKAKDGAIVIAEENIIEDFKESLKKIDLDEMPTKQTFIHIEEGKQPALIAVDSKITSNETSKLIGFEAQEIKFQKEPEDIIAIERGNDNDQMIYFQGPTPLLVIDGEIQNKDFDLEKVNPSVIKSMNVIKGKNAVEKYGDQGKDGVLEITLKSDEEIESEDLQNKKQSFTLSSWRYNDREKGNNTLTILNGNKNHSHHLPQESLLVLDGKVMGENFDRGSIHPQDIEKITVLKGPQATEKYGKKAAKGVIEITTKD
ncbi:MAG: M56 family metallopeptidase [Salinimicrobium sp.]